MPGAVSVVPVIPPTLTTDRLVLTPPGPHDLDDLAAMNGDPAVMDLIGSPVHTREESWHRLLRYIGHWQALGYGHWTVRLAREGVFLGSMGLMDSRRDTEPSFEGVVEAGWAFATAAQGRGYAAEAGAAMTAWADAAGPARLVAMIAPANAPSLRLAARLGFRDARAVVYRGDTLCLLERTRP